jgi:hypothetical protein
LVGVAEQESSQHKQVGAMATTILASPQSAQHAYRRRQESRQVRRIAFFALLVVATNVLFWFGLMN